MSEAQSLGQKGEAFAVEYLKKKGYKIRHRNWISGKNEIDIVAETNDFIVFVEVKTRADNPLTNPKTAVNREKQKSIIYVAEWYIRTYNLDKESRFDVIILYEKAEGFEIDHIENAFYPTLR